MKTEKRTQRIGVDVHAHVFNATDLPSAQFLMDVVFNLEESLPWYLKHLARELVEFAVRMLEVGVLTGKEELERLESLRGNRDAKANVIMAHQNELSARGCDLRFLAAIEEEIVELESSTDSEKIETARYLREAFNAENAELQANVKGLTGTLSEPFGGGGIALSSLGRSTNTALGGYIAFLAAARRSRFGNCEKLSSMFGGAGRVALYTPALIDYNHWLSRRWRDLSLPNEERYDTKTPLEDQIKVMEAVSAASGGAIHCFMAYDPLRDLKENGRSLALVKHAVESCGFIGVKLYPPMGFQAWGNAGLPFFDPDTDDLLDNDLGLELDKPLKDFFTWCISEDVPILAHSDSSVLSKKAYFDRPNPKHWKMLLSSSGIRDVRNLRVLLGHFCGFGGQLSEKTSQEEVKRIREWVETAVNAAKTFPHVYVDMSYHQQILEEGMDSQYGKSIAALLQANRVMAKRYCFGSDWLMLAKEKHHEEYRNRAESVLCRDAGLSDETIADILGSNALRFLGLTTPNSKPRNRLASWYKTNDVREPDWFRSALEFDA